MARVAHEARAPVLLEAASAGGGRPVAAGPQRGARGGERALLGTYVEIKFWALRAIDAMLSPYWLISTQLGAGKRARHRKVLEARRLESTGPRIPLPQFPQPGRAARRDVRAVEALDLVVGVAHVAGRRVDAVERAGIARAVLEEDVHGAAPC